MQEVAFQSWHENDRLKKKMVSWLVFCYGFCYMEKIIGKSFLHAKARKSEINSANFNHTGRLPINSTRTMHTCTEYLLQVWICFHHISTLYLYIYIYIPLLFCYMCTNICDLCMVVLTRWKENIFGKTMT